MTTHKQKVKKTLRQFQKIDDSVDVVIDTTAKTTNWLKELRKILKRKEKAKSPVRKSIETLRNELQKLFPDQNVRIQ